MADEFERELPNIQVRRESTAEQVATVLRGLIVAGTITPGTHLSEGPVSQQLGVSRNTVREALQILVSQGLVRREIHRGAYVSELDADDVRDLFRVRRLIELAAVRELTITGADLRELEAQLGTIAAAPTAAEVRTAELQFWLTLVELVRSERFGALHASVATELQLPVALAGDETVNAKKTVRHLRSIIAAMRRGDAEHAAGLAGDRLGREVDRHVARLGG
jgi:DNA-binding GntR family transcriptional regulator